MTAGAVSWIRNKDQNSSKHESKPAKQSLAYTVPDNAPPKRNTEAGRQHEGNVRCRGGTRIMVYEVIA